MSNPNGRARVYDRVKVLTDLCVFMARGDRCLEDICNQEPDFPVSESIYMWVVEDPQLFSIFTRAQELWCWAQRDKIIKIADDQSRDISPDGKSDNTAVNRDKLRVNTRQWAMAKLVPKLFGDKVEQTLIGDPEKPLAVFSDKPLTPAEFTAKYASKPNEPEE